MYYIRTLECQEIEVVITNREMFASGVMETEQETFDCSNINVSFNMFCLNVLQVILSCFN